MLIADPDHRVVVDLSAKAGSMALAAMFLEHAGFDRDADEAVHDERRRYSTAVGLRPGAIRQILLTPGRDGYRAFKFVRDPYSRAVSAYLHVGHSPRLHEPFLGDGAIDDLTFMRFLEIVSGMDPFQCNVHYRLQLEPFEDEMQPGWDDVVRLESLAEGLERINTAHGLAFRLPPHDRGREPDSDAPLADAAIVPFGDLRDGHPPYRSFLDDRTLALVEAIYGPDIARYGYRAPGTGAT